MKPRRTFVATCTPCRPGHHVIARLTAALALLLPLAAGFSSPVVACRYGLTSEEIQLVEESARK